MKLEMTTDFLDLIDPGSYGTNIGDLLDDVTDESIDDFFNYVLRCGMYQINDILSDPLIVESFGKCKASNGKIVRPQFYNYQNDAIEFDLEVPDKTIEKIRAYKYNRSFFQWTKNNYGSYSGFISFFPYDKERFYKALETSDLNFSRAFAMIFMKFIEEKFHDEDKRIWQRDFEDNVCELVWKYCDMKDYYDEE